MDKIGRIRVVFMGTPSLAAVILTQLLDWPGCCVAAAYTQPDRPAGRGKALQAPPVKQLALARNIPVFQPQHFKSEDTLRALAALHPDFLVVAAYGQILPQAVLDLPSQMAVNVHPSLLPQHRGPAPIQRALMRGDSHSGVSIMQMEAGLDTGPVLRSRSEPIAPEDNSGTLHEKLARLGGELLLETLQGVVDGRVVPIPQDDALASYAPKLTKHDGLVDCALSARALDARIRAVTPRPGAGAVLRRLHADPVNLVIEQGGPLPQTSREAPGALLGVYGKQLALACAEGVYGISRLRPAGRKSMDALSFANGYLKNRGEACLEKA